MNEKTNLSRCAIIYLIMSCTAMLLSIHCAFNTVNVRPFGVQADSVRGMPGSVFQPDSNGYSIEGHYWLGFADGKAAARGRSYPKLCLEGFTAGTAGGCLGAMIYTGMEDSEDQEVGTPEALAGAGIALTGGILFYNELKNPDFKFKFDTLIAADSFYCNGFKDGYLKSSRFSRIADMTGGCAIGSALVIGTICLIVGIISAISM